MISTHCDVRDIPDKGVSGRLRLARAILQLPSLLLPPEERKTDQRTEHSLIPLFLTAILRLTQGPDAQVNAEVWQISYAALLEATKRHRVNKQDIENAEIRVIIPAFTRGLEHKNRPVRLAAG